MIVIYVVLNSYCINSFGTTSYLTTIINTLISILLIVLIKVLDRTKYYGLTKVKDKKKYLYFIPLLIIGTVNIWNGFYYDIYYLDGISKKFFKELLDKSGEILLNDGMSSFGLGNFTTNDEIGKYKYN